MGRFDHIERPNSLKATRNRVIKTMKVPMDILLPGIVYCSVFFFGLTFLPLIQSPLLHFIGGIVSLILNVFTLLAMISFWFITGTSEFMRESLRMFPFAQPQLRVVIGLVFVIGLITRLVNNLVDRKKTSGFTTAVFIPLVFSIAIFYGTQWLNNYQDLQLSVAEQSFISLGFPFCYFFQRGESIHLIRRQNPEVDY